VTRPRVAALIFVVIVATGTGIGARALTGAGEKGATPSARRKAPAPQPSPQLVVDGMQLGQVPWDQPLRLRVLNAAVGAVSVQDEAGALIAGSIGPDGVWQTTTALVPLTRYNVDVETVRRPHQVSHQTVTVQTTDAVRHLAATISPGDGATVGVGMPIVVTLDGDVAKSKRAAVESRLSVTTNPPVAGAWHWMSGRELHWRPPAYWPPHTDVSVDSNFDRLDVGDGVWGAGHRSAHFAIGDAHVSIADVQSHVFTVTSNGRVQRVIPMSAGRDAYPTKNGIHIALEKSQVVTMDSQTVGIPRDSPDGYYEKVYWDVRISNGGAFVHAAPWSVGEQGSRNVSHGCVNISTSDAQWFYSFTQRGDVVHVVHSPAPPVLSDPGTADWNISWSAWLAGSAPS
jgi:lipoprotein-anchoring transpeptidase ErfK/SrfK